MVKKWKLRWYGHISRSPGMGKKILQGTVNGARRRGRQKKRWEDNIKKWIGRRQGKVERYRYNIIDSAPTAVKVKGLRWDESLSFYKIRTVKNARTIVFGWHLLYPPKLCLWGVILFSRCLSVRLSIRPWHFGFSLISWKGNDGIDKMYIYNRKLRARGQFCSSYCPM